MLASPFSAKLGWGGSGYIPAEMGDTFTTEAMLEDLRESAPDLMANVVRWTVFYRDGDRIRPLCDWQDSLGSIGSCSFEHESRPSRECIRAC